MNEALATVTLALLVSACGAGGADGTGTGTTPTETPTGTGPATGTGTTTGTPTGTVQNSEHGGAMAGRGGPATIAIVFNGQELWAGNDDFETDPNATYKGALHDVGAALDAQVAKGLPEGTRAMLVTYATGAKVLRPLGPAASMTHDALGAQRDYRGMIGSDMVLGVELAAKELERATAAGGTRRVVIVIGDGNDTNNELGRAALAKLKERFAAAHIAPYALVVKSPLSSEGDILNALTSPQRLSSPAELRAGLARVLDACCR